MASRLGTFGEVLYAISPKTVDIVLNRPTTCSRTRRAAKKEQGRRARTREEAAARRREEGRQRDVHGGRGDGLPPTRRALLAARRQAHGGRWPTGAARAGARAVPDRVDRDGLGAVAHARPALRRRRARLCARSRFLPATPFWRSTRTTRQRFPTLRWSLIVTRARLGQPVGDRGAADREAADHRPDRVDAHRRAGHGRGAVRVAHLHARGEAWSCRRSARVIVGLVPPAVSKLPFPSRSQA